MRKDEDNKMKAVKLKLPRKLLKFLNVMVYLIPGVTFYIFDILSFITEGLLLRPLKWLITNWTLRGSLGKVKDH